MSNQEISESLSNLFQVKNEQFVTGEQLDKDLKQIKRLIKILNGFKPSPNNLKNLKYQKQ